MPDLTLTEEEKMLQNLVRDFAEREVMPRAAELDEKAEFSHEKLARHGRSWAWPESGSIRLTAAAAAGSGSRRS